MKRIALAAAAAAVCLAPAAEAHVTMQPREAAAGGFTRLNVRVPNERDNAGTTKVEVQFPEGFASVSYEPAPGWDIAVKTVKLDEPIEGENGEITERVDTVTFTAEDDENAIAPGQFRDFGLSLRMPDGKAGDKITFKAIQTYENGEVVRWIGPDDADEPAPIVTLTAAGGGHGAAPATVSPVSTNAADADEAVGGDSNTLSVVALIVGGLGLLLGVYGVLSGRRRAASAAA